MLFTHQLYMRVIGTACAQNTHEPCTESVCLCATAAAPSASTRNGGHLHSMPFGIHLQNAQVNAQHTQTHTLETQSNFTCVITSKDRTITRKKSHTPIAYSPSKSPVSATIVVSAFSWSRDVVALVIFVFLVCGSSLIVHEWDWTWT